MKNWHEENRHERTWNNLAMFESPWNVNKQTWLTIVIRCLDAAKRNTPQRIFYYAYYASEFTNADKYEREMDRTCRVTLWSITIAGIVHWQFWVIRRYDEDAGDWSMVVGWDWMNLFDLSRARATISIKRRVDNRNFYGFLIIMGNEICLSNVIDLKKI